MPVLSHRRSVCEKAVAALAAGDRSALAPLLGITVAAALEESAELRGRVESDPAVRRLMEFAAGRRGRSRRGL